MQKVAKVIVDVPTMQTDQPFTYLVPENLNEQLAVGMRVEVPFGNGNRHVQGFVLAIEPMAATVLDEANVQLKELVAVLDLKPVLNTEMLALADYMKEKTFAFKITCLQTMLPSVMRADYQKYIYLTDELSEELQDQLFYGLEEISWDQAQERGILPQLMALRKQQKVDIRYEVTTRNKVKMVRFIQAAKEFEQLEEIRLGLRKGAKKKEQLLYYLQRLGTEKVTAVKEMKELGFSTALLNEAAKNGWLTFIEKEAYRDPFANQTFEKTTALSLNAEQQVAVETILQSVQEQQSQTYLLEGITGSGKTEVYLQVIAEVLNQGKTAIMLVPEISLTPQMVQRFKSRFGEHVAVMHSGLSQGEKYDEWRKIERGEAEVVVGARSAIFAPIENIGVIIIDEEHEASYKQEETPRYHARDLAIWRSEYHHCPVVLGSATPSLESRARAQKNVYQRLRLTQRANQAATLPTIDVVDMRQEVENGNVSSFSMSLQEKLQERLEKNEQSVLLLNRRGYSSFVMCRDCGYVLPCPNCDISLTLHMDSKTMKCHYCGHEERIPYRCPNCGQDKIRYYGTGTQKVEEELQTLLPDSRILRMDVDTTRRKGAHEKILRTFGEGQADILLGTQMIAKGLDFPNVTLVGVLNADTALNLPDFRSSERTFQLLTQVSGRAGRAEKPGEVIIQSFNPEHYAIQLAKAQDYEDFYTKEMYIRHRGNYPPYYFTVQITASHPEENEAAKQMFQIATKLKQGLSPQAILLGPTPNAIMRVNNRYFYQVIIKYKQEPMLQPLLKEILTDTQRATARGLKLSIDAEPMNFI
ncbi:MULTISPECIES: primosomal protein N' [Enterococcus]|jgi:primosomal protein N' (replication factor Y)|uniref:primosomal protein N' n=1 Tax=Enterococcus TaxID=1350 RepID=UPI000D3CAB6A|nr:MULTISPECIES: primosomal protein N' [Enterococcus]MDB1567195.1 primosomal protein N' [Enterococcus faecalis]MDB1569788.1 primosomal protein N' [Enterococcus faecalis]MDB1575329.1 primosomal protein N' [Enterococcus faecalis]MDB1650046.1 primosomal protein N' [Enterococcus faecalis]MDB1657998.1 primosomal protein N' [Enterococcus faecalis]